ncbi:MAG: DALR anticodon-binding domain-containing protein [Syntrophotaleaceae bacterium]
MVAFKRVGNIIKDGVDEAIDATLFEASCETALYEAVQKTAEQCRQLVVQGDYGNALQAVAALRAPVDAFFDGVMVMADDQQVKTNRLALLTAVARLLEQVADFSKLAG